MRKVLHIVGYYPPAIGGIEDVCYNIVTNTNDSFQNRVICYNHESRKTITSFHDGVTITRIGILAKLFKRQPVTISYFKILLREIKIFKPDIIYFHAPNPVPTILLLLVRLRKTKLIVYWHANVPDKLLKPIFYPLNYLLLQKADTITVATPFHLIGVKLLIKFQSKIKILPYAINDSKLTLSKLTNVKIESIKKQYNNKKIVLFVGRHVPYKGIDHLIEAANYLINDCVILIGGSGRLTEVLKSSVKSDKIHFIGRIPDEDLSAYLYAADIFAFPSINYGEAFGMALAEAMYCYTPAVLFTISSRSGVNWVSIKDETGLEVENGNSLEYAKAVDILLSDENLRIQLGKQAHERVVKYLMPEQFKINIKNIY